MSEFVFTERVFTVMQRRTRSLKAALAFFICAVLTFSTTYLLADLEITQTAVIVSPLYEAKIDSDHRVCSEITYRVKKADLGLVLETPRAFVTPRSLREVCLESDDYRGSGYERGHLRALSLSVGNPNWQDVNSMVAVVPMTPLLNNGEFRTVEKTIEELVRTDSGKEGVLVCIKSYWGGKKKQLVNADEPHFIPSGYEVRVTSLNHEYAWELDNSLTD